MNRAVAARAARDWHAAMAGTGNVVAAAAEKW
jgi:hypothetical protein